MKQHEWEQYTIDVDSIFERYVFYICKNCGAGIGDLFYKPGRRPTKIKILGSNTGQIGSTVYLTDDCEASQKRIQEYWEKETKNKGLYRKMMRMYSKKISKKQRAKTRNLKGNKNV